MSGNDSPPPLRPFRWDLGGDARLGTLLDGTDEPDPSFLAELVTCAALVLPQRELAQLRANFTADGLAPAALARRRRPVVFVDLVSSGSTFAELFHFLRGWIEEERAQWDVIRRKLRFLGVARREHTSPNTWRRHQEAEWPADLPARAIKNVSMAPDVWHDLGDLQPKATVSFRPHRWLDESVTEPARDATRRQGLAEAVALVQRGSDKRTRTSLATQLAQEPTFTEPWLRSLALELRR